VLERSTPPNPPTALDPEGSEAPVPGETADVETSGSSRGRGATSRKARAVDARAAKRIKGRTIYLPDDLFERILVQAHRRDRTISEYVAAILERQVPDHRTVRAEPAGEAEAGAA
jgi:hypothetical protein